MADVLNRPRDPRPLAVVTGATGGIGFEAAFQLLALGFEVVVGCRDPSSAAARDAVAHLRASLPPGAFQHQRHGVVTALRLDLASLRSVRAFAASPLSNPSSAARLRLLLNNAALRRRSERG